MLNAMIVDDEEDICELLQEALEKFELNVRYTLTGEEAVQRIRTQEFKLCIVDLRLSTEITGLDVIRIIREHSPKCIVVAMTGYVDIGLRQAAEKIGIDAFLAKPDDLREETFDKKIRTLLQLK